MRGLRHFTFGRDQKVAIDSLVAEAFGCTRNEAKRARQAGQVTVDHEVIEVADVPIADLEDKQLRAGDRAEAVRLER